MANITLMGASYTDVPAVTLPQTGGGTVTFYENGGGSIGGLANMVDVDTSDYHFAYMLMAMKKGNTVGGTITYTTAFSNTETLILQTGLNELHGIMFVQTDGDASTAESNYQSNKFVLITINSDSSFNIFGLSMNSTGGWQRNRVQGTKYENAPINGALRFASGDIYYTGRYNKNVNYQLLRTNKTYEWIAW